MAIRFDLCVILINYCAQEFDRAGAFDRGIGFETSKYQHPNTKQKELPRVSVKNWSSNEYCALAVDKQIVLAMAKLESVAIHLTHWSSLKKLLEVSVNAQNNAQSGLVNNSSKNRINGYSANQSSLRVSPWSL